jgi:hypothetical protein
VGDIKDDAEVIREVAEVIRLLQTDDVLAKLDTRDKPSESRSKVEQWLEKMADYTSYAETAYQATMIDPTEDRDSLFDVLQAVPSLPDETHASPISVRSQPSTEITDHGDSERTSLVDTKSEVSASGISSSTNTQARQSPCSRHTQAYLFSQASSSFISEAPSTGAYSLFSGQMQPISTHDGISTTTPSLGPRSTSQPVAPVTGRVVSESIEKTKTGVGSQLDWSPIVPEILSIAIFQEIVQSVKRDEEAIRKARQARNRLSSESRKSLDLELLQVVASSQTERPQSCDGLLAKGARPELRQDLVSNVLIQLVEQRDLHTLAVFLKHGVDPDGSPTASDPRQPLAVAASYDVACFCALALAGARLQGTQQSRVCGGFCQSGTQARSIRIFCSPFLAAFAAMRPQGINSIDKSQFWISHFLLVNGADVNFKTCTTARELVVRHWKIQTQYRITKHLLSFGMDVNSPEADLQFRFAMQAGDVRLAQLLLDNGASSGEIARRGHPSQDPLVLAAGSQNPDCIDLLLRQKWVDHIHLFHLIHVYMGETCSPLTEGAVAEVVKAFLGKNQTVASEVRERWTYYRLTESGSEPNEEENHYVSMVELAKTIVNKGKRDRDYIVELLRPTHGSGDPSSPITGELGRGRQRGKTRPTPPQPFNGSRAQRTLERP